MNALTLISNGLPRGRRALLALSRQISDAEAQLDRLTRGRDQLRAELSRADTAKNELDSLMSEDASSLVGKLRSGASWALAHFGSARAQNLVAALAESQVQLGVGAKALAAIEKEIAVAEREVADWRASKADVVRSVLIEAADGWRTDALTAIDDLKQAMTILAGLDRLTKTSDGSWSPNERMVVEIPSLGGMPAQACVIPESCIARAQSILNDFAAELDINPLADIETLSIPHTIGSEDDGRILYDRMTQTERNRVDQSRALGVN